MNLAERSELTAMKASGMFFRILRPLVLCMVIVSSGVLVQQHRLGANVGQAPLYSVTKQRPALNVREGVFYNGIDGFSIRVHPTAASTTS